MSEDILSREKSQLWHAKWGVQLGHMRAVWVHEYIDPVTDKHMIGLVNRTFQIKGGDPKMLQQHPITPAFEYNDILSGWLHKYTREANRRLYALPPKGGTSVGQVLHKSTRMTAPKQTRAIATRREMLADKPKLTANRASRITASLKGKKMTEWTHEEYMSYIDRKKKMHQIKRAVYGKHHHSKHCLLYTSPSPRDS